MFAIAGHDVRRSKPDGLCYCHCHCCCCCCCCCCVGFVLFCVEHRESAAVQNARAVAGMPMAPCMCIGCCLRASATPRTTHLSCGTREAPYVLAVALYACGAGWCYCCCCWPILLTHSLTHSLNVTHTLSLTLYVAAPGRLLPLRHVC